MRAIVLVVLVLLEVVLAVGPASGGPDARGPGYAAEARHLVTTKGAVVWPGWRAAALPGRVADTGGATRVRALVELAFRAFVSTSRRGRQPSFGEEVTEQDALGALRSLPGVEARLASESAALASAMNAASLVSARRAVADFLRLRAERLTLLPAGVAGFERRIEWTDGTARYAGIRLLLEAGSPGYRRLAPIAYPKAVATRATFLRALADPKPLALGVRGRWQLLGAAQALVLDRLLAGWQARVLAGEPLDALLAEAVEVPGPLAGLRAARLMLAGSPIRVALAEQPDQRARGLMGISSVVPLDGMLFAFPDDVQGSFWMKNTLIPLDIGFFAVTGDLVEVLTMTPCEADPCPSYQPRGAYRYALELPAERLAGLLPGTRLSVPRL